MTAILDALLEGTGDLVCLHDREGRFITANEAYASAVGVPVSSLLGRMPGEVFPGSETASAEAAARRALLTGQPVETEEPLGLGSARRWFSVRRIPYRDSGSRVLGTICISRDVTERHLAFSRLEEQERRFRGLVDAMPLAIWLIDPRRRIMFQNRAHRETFGAAVEGCACYMALHGGLQACDNCPMDQVLEGQTHRRSAWRSPKTDKVFDIHTVPYPARDGESGVLEILVDVTDRERAESQLRESQRLESLGGLAAGIAHDFNNILAGIIGYAQLGEQRAEAMADLRDPFVQIRAVAERGAELTRKILAFSRRQALKPVPLDLNALVQGLQPMLVPLVHGMVGLRFDLGQHIWAVVADRGQVEQVLFNLCVNAVEAMATGGVLTVTSRNVPAAEMSRVLGTEFRGNGVEVTVQDTGQGMSPEVMARAFEPFFTTKGRGRGTGLGLAVSYGIVRQHGGTIRLESKVGAGTRACLYLPATDVTPSSLPKQEQPGPRRERSHTGRAIVVEDESAIRTLVMQLMRDLGFTVDGAPTGDDAWKLCMTADPPYDVVVTDIAMPGMNGHQLARHLQAERPGSAIIYMTGCADTTLEQYGVGGDIPILRKPFAISELTAKVDEALGKR